jgi:hypothetical protein
MTPKQPFLLDDSAGHGATSEGDTQEDRGPVVRLITRQAREISRQLIEQRLGLLQHWRVEAFGEPVVDRREQIMGFGALALIAPEEGEVCCGT